jgi:chemotaxis response regulator CheB
LRPSGKSWDSGRLLGALPADYPIPILIVQHIAAGFTEGLVPVAGSRRARRQ